MSSGLNKITIERNQKAVQDLATHPGNDVCADCKARYPRWTSANLGIFICMNCASIHRKMGTHISKVKSITLDQWTKEQIEHMKQNGNIKSNSIYNPDETRHPPPANLLESERDSELEKYIRAKYQYKKFIDKSAFVASQLGPSQSLSNKTLRPQTAPIPHVQSSTSASSVSQPSGADYGKNLEHRAPTLSNNAVTSSTAVLPTRSVSQPFPLQSQPQYQPQSQPQSQSLASSSQHTARGGVWDDLIALQSPSQSSSLPLQYQPSQGPAVQPQPLSIPQMNTGAGPSFNPYTNMSTNPSFLGATSPFSAGSQGAPFSTNGAQGLTAPHNPFQLHAQHTGFSASAPSPFSTPFGQTQPGTTGGMFSGLAGSPFQAQPFGQSQQMLYPPTGASPTALAPPVNVFSPQPHGVQQQQQQPPFVTTPSPFAQQQQQPQQQQFASTPSPFQQQQQQQPFGTTPSPFQQQPFGTAPSPFQQQPFGTTPSPYQQQPFGTTPSPFQQQPSQMYNTGNPFFAQQQWSGM